MAQSSSGNSSTSRLIYSAIGVVILAIGAFFGLDGAKNSSSSQATSPITSASEVTKTNSTNNSTNKAGTNKTGTNKTSTVTTTSNKNTGDKNTGDKNTSKATSQKSSLAACPLNTLPKEAREVVDLIEQGGPFAHPDNDGVRFGNYEKRLPAESKNYYREYTVDTPGLNHRGARRIVTGGGSKTSPETWYYTDDHYDSFCEITEIEN